MVAQAVRRTRTSVPGAPADDPLGPEHELFVRCRQGDAHAREQLILRFVPLAERLALRYRRSVEPTDDLVQVAMIGLIKAIDGFDPGRGVLFVSYAAPTILGELKHHFRDLTWAVRVPHTLGSLALTVGSHRTDLAEQLHREPTTSELATAVGVRDTDILEALLARGAYRALSFNAPSVTSRTVGSDPTTLADAVGIEDGGFEHAERRATLSRLLPALDSSEREVIRMRFDDDMTQTQMATKLGVSQMQISRLIRHAIEHLRATHDTLDGEPAHAA